MLTFNKNEQTAILALTALLLVGTLVSAADYLWPSQLDTFEVRKSALPVPEILPVESADSAHQPTEVNLNSATAAELQSLPQVGPKTARLILNHRQSIGKFSSINQLTAVKGIGPKTREKLRHRVTLTDE